MAHAQRYTGEHGGAASVISDATPAHSGSDELDLRRPRDVVVVGGGIVGLSIAHELADSGRDVTVIDRDTVGTGCAAGSAGHIVPSHIVPLASPGAVRDAVSDLMGRDGALSVKLGAGPILWRWLGTFMRSCTPDRVDSAAPAIAELGALSVDLLDRWISENRIECHRETDGLLDVYGDDTAFGEAVRAGEALRNRGVAVEILTAERVQELEPACNDATVGGVWFPDDGHVHPARFLDGLVRAVAAKGVELHSGITLTGLDGESGTVSAVRTSHGVLVANDVVIATGAWTGRFAKAIGEQVPVVPARGFSFTSDQPTTGPRRALLLGERHVAVGPMGDELRLSGRFELGRYTTNPVPKRIAQIERLARSRLTFDEPLRVRDTWAGLRPVTPDGVPTIGRSSASTNVTLATGHAMIGLTLGPGTGRIAAQMVNGHPTDIDPARFAPQRFS